METTLALTFIGLVPQILIQVRVRDLLERLDLVHGHEGRVQVHKLDCHLLEGALREQVPLDARERLVRVVVRLGVGLGLG